MLVRFHNSAYGQHRLASSEFADQIVFSGEEGGDEAAGGLWALVGTSDITESIAFIDEILSDGAAGASGDLKLQTFSSLEQVPESYRPPVVLH